MEENSTLPKLNTADCPVYLFGTEKLGNPYEPADTRVRIWKSQPNPLNALNDLSQHFHVQDINYSESSISKSYLKDQPPLVENQESSFLYISQKFLPGDDIPSKGTPFTDILVQKINMVRE